MNSKCFILIAGLPNLGKHNFAERYYKTLKNTKYSIIDENDYNNESLIKKLRDNLLEDNELVILISECLKFTDRKLIIDSIKDINCRKSLMFFYKEKSEFIKINDKLENPLSKDEISDLYDIVEVPNSKYEEGFDLLFIQ